MARTLRQRFATFVDTSGEHHLWTGAIRRDSGTGRVRVDGKEVAAHQAAWELERGPVPTGTRVLPCPEVSASCHNGERRTTPWACRRSRTRTAAS